MQFCLIVWYLSTWPCPLPVFVLLFLVLCHLLSASPAWSPIRAPRQSWLWVMEQSLEYCWRKKVTKDPSLMPCWPDIGLESWIGIRFPEEKAEVLALGFWSLARVLVARTARSGWKKMTHLWLPHSDWQALSNIRMESWLILDTAEVEIIYGRLISGTTWRTLPPKPHPHPLLLLKVLLTPLGISSLCFCF